MRDTATRFNSSAPFRWSGSEAGTSGARAGPVYTIVRLESHLHAARSAASVSGAPVLRRLKVDGFRAPRVRVSLPLLKPDVTSMELFMS